MQQATAAILKQADEILVKPLHPDNLVRIILDRLSLATWLGPLRRFVLAHPLGR
jgi:hypothetical protein